MVASGAGYVVDAFAFCADKELTDLTKAVTFQEGTTYYLWVNLKAKSGYAFTTNATFATNAGKLASTPEIYNWPKDSDSPDYSGMTAAFSFQLDSSKATQNVTVTAKQVAMGKTVLMNAKTSGNGKLTYASSNAKVAKVSATGKITPVKVGMAYVTVKAAATSKYAKASKKVKVTVVKGANTLTAKGKTATVKASAVKKAAQTVKRASAIAVSKQKGKLTYKKVGGNGKITVSTTAIITVKKGLKKGSYKLKVNVKAAGNANWKAGSKTVTATIKVQ